MTDYTTYAGDTRRIITVPIVDALSTTGNMTVLGFRQFLMEASPGTDTNIPTDPNGRFIALYIGSVAPVKQGRFDGGCDASSGPGKGGAAPMRREPSRQHHPRSGNVDAGAGHLLVRWSRSAKITYTYYTLQEDRVHRRAGISARSRA